MPDHLGMAAIVVAVAAGTAALGVGAWWGAGLWGVGGSVLTVVGTLEVGKHVVRLRLPDTENATAELARALTAAAEAAPGVTIVPAEGGAP